MTVKILLLQAREATDDARIEERNSFAMRAGLDVESIVPHDLLAGPPTLSQIRSHDALMVGGSGDYSVAQRNLPHLPQTLEILAGAADFGRPIFASCFGFHLLVQALGGEVIYDPPNMEVGTYDLTLTTSGREDELFGTLPPSFRGQMGHKDRAQSLPPGAVNLAASEKAPFQAFRLPGRPIWATQFHPEMTKEDNLLRFDRYMNAYSDHYTLQEIETVRSRFTESTAANNLIPTFLDLIR